ncbi:lipase containing protein, putative [Entamoeba invadens IP1]|uniref:sn-1-specific diacylglycerol lipase n=1 Tax=Entamoeba invadens IP1 TaxID=370355 RepID=A0A0A1UHA0_ENTIV|nr:lipase containing protein, putative [Entamoeba invadens IP1]ELP94957.1 lipase containing protein, putative [Entamoeba invadens IP1]|eukprot:XP_004261728.1 lipase containing protein, putative [Entamoeba invadens IP1]
MEVKPITVQLETEKHNDIDIVTQYIDAFISTPGNGYSEIIQTYLKESGVSVKDFVLTIHKINTSKVDVSRDGVIEEITDIHKFDLYYYYIKLCMVSYGKWVFIQGNKESGIFKKAKALQSSEEEFDYKLAKKMCGLEKEDIVEYQYKAKLFDPSHFIAVTKSVNSIVVVIRGTLSFDDAKVDLCAKPVPYDFNGIKGFTHAGVYKCALNKYQQIIKTLSALRVKYPKYDITFVGHSLGGAVAQVLTLEVYKKHPNWPLKCYGFASALCLSLNISTDPLVCDLIDTIISKEDIVPRLSYDSVLGIRPFLDEVKQIHEQTKLINLMSKETTERFEAAFKGFYQSTRNIGDNVLVPAGHVYHILKTKEDGERAYRMFRKDNKVFGWLFIRVLSLSDHFPYNYYHVIEKLMATGGN